MFTNSTSEYLCILDSDDWVHPRYLEYLYTAASSYNVSISICAWSRTNHSTVVFPTFDYHDKEISALDFLEKHDALVASPCNKLYKKHIFKDMRYPLNKFYEDEFVTYKLLYNAQNLAFVDLPLYIYFQRAGSAMNSFSMKKLYDALEALEQEAQFFRDNKAIVLWKQKILYIIVNILGTRIQSESFNQVCMKRDIQILRKKQRIYILKYRKQIDLKIETYPQVYEQAFPIFMWIYWTIKGVLAKIKNWC